MLVSVILPVHNTAHYLPKCVESIIKQGLQAELYEVILVENASTDNSLNVCKELKTLYGRYHINVIHTDTPGVGNARNLGIMASRGKYIHFIDSDDWIESGMYAHLITEVANNDLLITGIKNDYPKNGYIIENIPSNTLNCENRHEISMFLSQIDAKQKVWALNVIWNKWYRADIIKKSKIRFREDINLGEDFVFNCEYFQRIESLKIIASAYYHYMHREIISLVNKFRIDVLYRRPIIYNAYCALYEHYRILNENKYKIDLLEGKLLFGSLYTVFNKDCALTVQEKIAFMKQICESKHFELGILYIKSSKLLYHKILKDLFEKKLYSLALFLLYIRLKISKFINILIKEKWFA